MKNRYWTIGGKSVKLKRHQRTLDIDCVNRALKNASNPAFMINHYLHPRSNRLRAIMASKNK